MTSLVLVFATNTIRIKILFRGFTLQVHYGMFVELFVAVMHYSPPPPPPLTAKFVKKECTCLIRKVPQLMHPK